MAVTDEMIRDAAGGNRAAQQQIYHGLSGRVHTLVSRIVGPRDAEDVTQEVFIQLFNRLESFRFDSSLATWVYRLAVNEALQHLRRSRRQSTVSWDQVAHSGEEALLAKGSQASVQQAIDTRELVAEALSRMDAELRLILQLKEWDQLSYEEIARIVDVPEGTVGSRLNRARRQLRDQLQQLGWES